MMDRRWVLGAALVVSASPGWAAEVPLYRPVPDWVKPAPPVDAARLGADAPILMMLDQQQRLADGEVWSYQDVATRLASPEVVAKAGTVFIPWSPAKGDLIVHRVEVLRGAERIDALAGGRRFQVLRREQRLEEQSLDGQLTATLAVEGLQVGDVLRVTASTTTRETAFGGAMQTAAVVPMLPAKTGFVRTRLLWPKATEVRWRAYAEGAAPAVTEAGGFRELLLAGPLPKAAELPDDAPLRFRRLPVVEATSFAGWEAVSSATARLYATDGLIAPGSPLAGEVARIVAAHADPRARAAAALELVQDKVRYLFNGLGNGNYRPQSPADTWTLRYGDCKAKTLLLVAMLRAMDIRAEAVLASSQLGDLLPDRLPMAGAFDHVLVRAEIDGRSLWLDGTDKGARLADLDDVGAFGHVLPLRPDGTGLVRLAPRAPARPNLAVRLDIDQSAGLSMPALVDAEVRLRGPMAEMVELVRTQGSREQQVGAVSELVGKVTGTSVTLSSFAMRYDPASGEATVTAKGIGQNRWRRENGRWRLALDQAVKDLSFEPNRTRPAWAAIPASTGNAETTAFRTSLRLPGNGAGFATEGDTGEIAPLPGMLVRRKVTLDAGTLVVDERFERSGAEIAPADIPAARERLARAKARLLTALAPETTPARWRAIADARANGGFKPILARYAEVIAADPEDRDGYINRARFLVAAREYKAALPDLDRALAIQADAEVRRLRGEARRMAGQDARAREDYEALVALDPDALDAFGYLATDDLDHGRREAALARVQERIDAGGTKRPNLLMMKADLLARAGSGAEALAAADEAIRTRPGDPALLNGRCWLKGQLATALDTALKDCTKAIELDDSPAGALDSRALAYLRLGRMDEARADVDAALELAPDLAGSLYLRAILQRRAGDTAAADRDLAAARLLSPRIDEDYTRWGLTAS